MDLAHLEGGHRRIGQVFEELVGEGWLLVFECALLLRFVFHEGIIAWLFFGTRGKGWSAGILRTGVVDGGKILCFGLRRACVRLRHLHVTRQLLEKPKTRLNLRNSP